MNLRRFTILLMIPLLTLVFSCKDDEPDDNDEMMVTETCDDGIKNQDEEEIDCGGSCDPCEEEVTITVGSGLVAASVNGTAWESNSTTSASFPTENNFLLMATNPDNGEFSQITITAAAFTAAGTIPGSRIVYRPSQSGPITYASDDGAATLTITSFENNQITGTFSGDVSYTDTDTGVETTLAITNGQFKDIPLQ